MKISVAVPPWGQVVPWEDEYAYLPFHEQDECDGEVCAIHAPSHHMGEWDIVLRLDYGWPLVERTCEHGVGHPDPDSVAWYEDKTKQKFYDAHGCDGCCSEP